MLTRTSFHILGRLYLPMFLLWMGLLTLMYMDSLIALAKLQPSLHMILKLSRVVRWHVVDWWPYMCKGALRCSLNLSLNVLEDSLMYSSLHPSLFPLNQYVIQLFCCIWSLYFGITRMFLSVLLHLTYVWMPCILHL